MPLWTVSAADASWRHCPCRQPCPGESPSACPRGPLALGGLPPLLGQETGPDGAAWPQRGAEGGAGRGRSPPGGPGAAPPPSPAAPPAPPSAPSSGGPGGGSAASEERPLLADRRGMSSGGSRHVTRRRSSSSPSSGSNFQPAPWEQRRARWHRRRAGARAGPAGWRRRDGGAPRARWGARRGRGARRPADPRPARAPRMSPGSLVAAEEERPLDQAGDQGWPWLCHPLRGPPALSLSFPPV